jgi:hypothetical protein
MSIELSEEDMRKAIDRIARTADGEALYHYLLRVLMSYATESASDGALRHNDGRRSLAHELMGHMAEGLRSAGLGQQSVIFARREPARDKRRLTAREWLARHDVEPEFYSDADFTSVEPAIGPDKPKG